MAYSDFLPEVVVALEHCEVVLQRDDEAMAGYELFESCTREIAARAESHDGSLGQGIVVTRTELT